MKEPQVGHTRIVRVDVHNVAVEVYTEIEETVKVAEKRVKTGAVRHVWQERGYYGGNLVYAAQSALYEAMPIGEQITPAMIKDAAKQIVEAMK